MLSSVWENTSTIPAFPRLCDNTKTDVLIIGGGLAGILIAYTMAQAGIDYLLIEANEICGGVTRNTTAKITSQHGLIYNKIIREFGADTARLYREANESAVEKYRVLCEKIPCDFEIKDAYIYSTCGADKIWSEMTALNKLGIYAEYADRLQLPFPVSGAVRFGNQAQFNPLKFVSGIVRGLNICEHTAAISAEGNTVLTNRGRIKASNIIVATHFPIINKHGSYFLKMYQDRSYVIALDNAPDLNGMYLDEAENGLSFRNYNDLLFIGGGAHRTGKQSKGWAELESFSKKYYPESEEKYRWATQDCMTLDGIPYIGKYSQSTHNLYVATGFNKWGMTSSMTAAAILCDMVQGKNNLYAPVFSPSRTILRQQLFINLFEAGSGLLTPAIPRCPHMGCALKWNPKERSWDCTCHGSRFSEKGKLLNNPSMRDLDKK